jgi:transposase InsO family protein
MPGDCCLLLVRHEVLLTDTGRRTRAAIGDVEAIPAAHVLEFLSDNVGTYIAADTRSMARQLGLKPINTAVRARKAMGWLRASTRLSATTSAELT